VGYPRDLEEMTDEELTAEIVRRSELRKDGLCAYCKQPFATGRCKIHEVGTTGIVQVRLVLAFRRDT
jgi:hypothetical protein